MFLKKKGVLTNISIQHYARNYAQLNIIRRVMTKKHSHHKTLSPVNQ